MTYWKVLDGLCLLEEVRQFRQTDPHQKILTRRESNAAFNAALIKTLKIIKILHNLVKTYVLIRGQL